MRYARSAKRAQTKRRFRARRRAARYGGAQTQSLCVPRCRRAAPHAARQRCFSPFSFIDATTIFSAFRFFAVFSRPIHYRHNELSTVSFQIDNRRRRWAHGYILACKVLHEASSKFCEQQQWHMRKKVAAALMMRDHGKCSANTPSVRPVSPSRLSSSSFSAPDHTRASFFAARRCPPPPHPVLLFSHAHACAALCARHAR